MDKDYRGWDINLWNFATCGSSRIIMSVPGLVQGLDKDIPYLSMYGVHTL
jgi:hypothetical protein